LGDGRGVWSRNNLHHISSKVLVWKKWSKNLTGVHLEDVVVDMFAVVACTIPHASIPMCLFVR